MSEATSQILLQAYELIEADRQHEARALLEPILDSERENADAWWLYIHAVDSQDEAKQAIASLAALDPHYPGVSDLTTKFGSTQALPSSFAEQEPRHLSSGYSRRWLRLALIATLLIVVVALYVLFSGDSETPSTQTSTEPVVQQAILTATEPVTGATSSETSPPPISEEGVATILADFELADPSIQIRDSAMGRITLFGVCTSDEPRVVLDSAMLKIAELSTGLSDTTYIGVEMTDCATQSPVNSVIVSLIEAQQYFEGQIDQQTYISRWRALG